MTNIALKCRCGTLQGYVDRLETATRGICYCRDCQAFARYLGRDSDVLDERGGTEILQILPKHVHFKAGLEELACVRLTGRGLLRWYARCCRTPVGNTPSAYRISYVGLVRDCVSGDDGSLEGTVGPVGLRVLTNSAIGQPKPKLSPPGWPRRRSGSWAGSPGRGSTAASNGPPSSIPAARRWPARQSWHRKPWRS